MRVDIYISIGPLEGILYRTKGFLIKAARPARPAGELCVEPMLLPTRHLEILADLSFEKTAVGFVIKASIYTIHIIVTWIYIYIYIHIIVSWISGYADGNKPKPSDTLAHFSVWQPILGLGSPLEFGSSAAEGGSVLEPRRPTLPHPLEHLEL